LGTNRFLDLASGVGKPVFYEVNQSSKRNNGSAAILTGHCYLLNVFLKDRVSSWTGEEKAMVKENLAVAVDFIMDYAQRYRMDLKISQGYRGFDNDLKFPGRIPVDMLEHPDWTERVFKLMGYPSGNEAVRRLKKEFQAEQIVFLYHVNKMGRSFNLTYSFGIDPIFRAERDVMYRQYEDGRPTCAASYAHEILHSFGAGELYFDAEFSAERETRAGEYFPNDVMRRVDYDIKSLTIGEYTAYRVGWLDGLDKKFEIFEDNG
jgi:hypothetical protein